MFERTSLFNDGESDLDFFAILLSVAKYEYSDMQILGTTTARESDGPSLHVAG